MSPASGHLAEPQHERRGRWAGLLDPLPGRVLERLDLAVGLADHDDVADPQGARLDDDGGDRAAPLVQLGLDDRADRLALRVCLELLEVGDQVHHVEQVVEALARLRRDQHERDVAAVLLDHDVRLGQLGLDPIGVRVRLVDLVEGDDDRHLGRPGVSDRLERLGHDTVVGRDHDDRDVGDLGAPGPHRGERLVAGRVEEDDLLVVLDDLRRTDVLGDPAALPGRDRGAPDRVEQARLAVVDVAHDGDDRRARHEQRGVLVHEQGDLGRGGRRLGALFLRRGDRRLGLGRLEPELRRHERRGVTVDQLVDRGEDAALDELPDHVGGVDREDLGELLDRDRRRQHDGAAVARLGDRDRREAAALTALRLAGSAAAAGPAPAPGHQAPPSWSSWVRGWDTAVPRNRGASKRPAGIGTASARRNAPFSRAAAWQAASAQT